MPSIVKKPIRRYALGIDGNAFHLRKCKDFDFYDDLLEAPSESYPAVADGTFQTVFIYVYHGLRSYKDTLREAKRILKNDGEIYLLAYSDQIRKNFVCYELAKEPEPAQSYFGELDNGRHDELCGYSRPLGEWLDMFAQLDLKVTQMSTQVSPIAWRTYDTQTRPLLKSLINWDKKLRERALKTEVKSALIDAIISDLEIFTQKFALPRSIHSPSELPDIFLTFRLVKSRI